MAGKGHENAFPPPRLSARCQFSQGTFAGTRGNGGNAPYAAIREDTIERLNSTHSGRSLISVAMDAHTPKPVVPDLLPDHLYRGSLWLRDSLNTAGWRSFPQILFPALRGCLI